MSTYVTMLNRVSWCFVICPFRSLHSRACSCVSSNFLHTKHRTCWSLIRKFFLNSLTDLHPRLKRRLLSLLLNVELLRYSHGVFKFVTLKWVNYISTYSLKTCSLILDLTMDLNLFLVSLDISSSVNIFYLKSEL